MAIDKKNIRNYTSEADPLQSQLKIEQFILNAGGRNITKIYDEHRNCTSIQFILPVNNMQMPFILEGKVDMVYKFMIKQYDKKPTEVQDAACRRQAARTAWKNLLEVLQIQLDMVAIEQIDLMQALLALLWNGKETFYDKVKKTEFKLLLDK